MNKKLIVSLIVFFASIFGFDFIVRNLRWANTIYQKKTILINAKIVDRNTSETSEGIFDCYYLEFVSGGLKMKNDSVTIWRNRKLPYSIGDSIKLIVSTGKHDDVEALDNLNSLKLNIVFSIALIIIILYSLLGVIRQVFMFRNSSRNTTQ